MSDDLPVQTEPAGSESAAGLSESGAEPLTLPLDPDAARCMGRWLSAATNAACADTRLFAKLIAARDLRNELALLGLTQHEWSALLARHFAHAPASALRFAVGRHVTASEHIEFVRTLHALLLTHASAAVDPDDAQRLATIIAHTCLRPDHLWRDLGLAGRDEVTWMLTRYFPTLVALNVANLRWKKFLAGQRALSLGLPPGPAPGCPGCEDYGHCFPEPR
jgi:nitrogen fixation protein NifQ